MADNNNIQIEINVYFLIYKLNGLDFTHIQVFSHKIKFLFNDFVLTFNFTRDHELSFKSFQTPESEVRC